MTAVHLKFTLRRIRLDRGGYDSYGAYYGHGLPLYEFEAVNDPSISGTLRAKDRDAAKQHIWKHVHRGAQFHN